MLASYNLDGSFWARRLRASATRILDMIDSLLSKPCLLQVSCLLSLKHLSLSIASICYGKTAMWIVAVRLTSDFTAFPKNEGHLRCG